MQAFRDTDDARALTADDFITTMWADDGMQERRGGCRFALAISRRLGRDVARYIFLQSQEIKRGIDAQQDATGLYRHYRG